MGCNQLVQGRSRNPSHGAHSASRQESVIVGDQHGRRFVLEVGHERLPKNVVKPTESRHDCARLRNMRKKSHGDEFMPAGCALERPCSRPTQHHEGQGWSEMQSQEGARARVFSVM